MAITKEAASVMETVIGIDLMNEPMIPVDKSNGRKAQIVVRVVVVSKTL
jgi:hypothetical protein